MKLTFKVSFDNYYEYNRVYSKIAVGKNLKSIFKMGGFATVAGVTAIAMYFARLLEISLLLYGGAILTVIGLYMMLYSKALFYLKLKKDVRRKFKNSDYFKNERTVEFFGDYMVAHSENDDYCGDYDEDLKEFIETENLFMIMVHGRRGIIVPKAEVDAQELRALLKKISEENDVRYRYIKE